MAILHFQCRGEWFAVDEKGRIKGNGLANHSDGWLFLGVSKHHWSNSIDVRLADAFKDPKSLLKGLVWDRDHGTTRVWGGRYAGKLPRVTAAYVE